MRYNNVGHALLDAGVFRHIKNMKNIGVLSISPGETTHFHIPGMFCCNYVTLTRNADGTYKRPLHSIIIDCICKEL